jgi:hypothetical protein
MVKKGIISHLCHISSRWFWGRIKEPGKINCSFEQSSYQIEDANGRQQKQKLSFG